jgi:hypothetical protein
LPLKNISHDYVISEAPRTKAISEILCALIQKTIDPIVISHIIVPEGWSGSAKPCQRAIIVSSRYFFLSRFIEGHLGTAERSSTAESSPMIPV